jgi:hypothetical protein
MSWPRTALDRVPRHPATLCRWAELMAPFADPGAALPNKSYKKTGISAKNALAASGTFFVWVLGVFFLVLRVASKPQRAPRRSACALAAGLGGLAAQQFSQNIA